MLFDVAAHEPLVDAPWDDGRVRWMIDAVAASVQEAFEDGALWPLHPLDADGPAGQLVSTSLYLGAAGTLRGLAYLASVGAVETSLDFDAVADQVLSSDPDPFPPEFADSLMGGRTGVLTALWASTGREDILERARESVSAGLEARSNEIFYGVPGLMLAALGMHEAGADERWAGLYRVGAERLLSSWWLDVETGTYRWTQELRGGRQFYGAGHGFAGNILALLRGASQLPAEQLALIQQRAVDTAIALAIEEGGQLNWARADIDWKERFPFVLQWCHGAPGFVTCFSRIPQGVDPRLDSLLLRAAETTWIAGPLAKGAGLCHGTAGNGYAFLELYRRNGDHRWLESARRFAMHAAGQVERDRRRYGQPRFSLWTGDIGTAIYLWQCITAEPAWPTLDWI